jgi:hypothetical protein
LSLYPLWSISGAVEAAYHHHSSTQLRKCNHDVIDRRSLLAAGSALATTRFLPSSSAVVHADTLQPVSLIGGPRVPLEGSKNGFPLASFGLQVSDDETAYRLTLTALEVGYRNFFASVLAGESKGICACHQGIRNPSRRSIYLWHGVIESCQGRRRSLP